MRLTEDQKNAIVRTADEYFGPECRVLLFGSRTDDDRRGGDIDLFVDVSHNADEAHARKIPFVVALKKRIGDRKIDVVLRTPDSPAKSIIDVAEKEGVNLR